MRRDANPVQLGDTLPLPYAQGLAEDYARHLGVARLVEAEAPWRQHPATEKQMALLRKLGMATRAGLTKGEAAELLRPGGQLIYSTCSIDPQENEQVAALFSQARPGWRFVSSRLVLPESGSSPTQWRDGGYWAAWQRPAGAV